MRDTQFSVEGATPTRSPINICSVASGQRIQPYIDAPASPMPLPPHTTPSGFGQWAIGGPATKPLFVNKYETLGGTVVTIDVESRGKAPLPSYLMRLAPSSPTQPVPETWGTANFQYYGPGVQPGIGAWEYLRMGTYESGGTTYTTFESVAFPDLLLFVDVPSATVTAVIPPNPRELDDGYLFMLD